MARNPQRRLRHILRELTPALAPVGTLKLGDITYEVPASLTPSRLVHSKELLDMNNLLNRDNLHWMLQKYLLGQDLFLVSQPGPYARRLTMTFASMINAEYEYISLHRDVGETELKQGREIRMGGNLVYVDSPVVRAVKHGRLLILEGIEKAERGIMPVLNNLLENREMNLEDGTHIIHPHRHTLLETSSSPTNHISKFIPAHKNFRVIAIAAPVPPYPGYPLDPPFRSRFQARFIDSVGSLIALGNPSLDTTRSTSSLSTDPADLFTKLRDIILSTQLTSESSSQQSRAISTTISRSKSVLPSFPQTALVKLATLLTTFPPSPDPNFLLSPRVLARLLLTIHPELLYAPVQAWAVLAGLVAEGGLGELPGNPSTAMMSSVDEPVGLLGYRVEAIERVDTHTARVTFSNRHLQGLVQPVVLNVPAGPNKFLPFPFDPYNLRGRALGLNHPSERFIGLLTCFLQAHALGWDISLVPPAMPATASTSTGTLVKVFGEVLGYGGDADDESGNVKEVVHLYKELGGREVIMRRRVGEGAMTSWEPSPLINGAWKGALVHLEGIDVIGSTAGSLARLVQDREVELWEGRRIVGEAEVEKVTHGTGDDLISVAHPSFRIIATASKSLPLKDWLFPEHANMFWTIPSQPMDRGEERQILLDTECPSLVVEILLDFAERYRHSMSEDSMVKNRKLGTRTLVRIARRIAAGRVRGWEDEDLYGIISRTLLTDFLPPLERMNIQTMLDETGIERRASLFHSNPIVTDASLIFPSNSTSPAVGGDGEAAITVIPRFDQSNDPEGVKSHVPYMDHFYDNSLQSGLMRDIAIDLEILEESVVLLGNQGVGKNKIVDRLCQLLNRPLEYIQLHRDTTVNQLMFTTTLDSGTLRYTNSPLLRAIIHGRIMVVDEADKAPEHVVAVFRSLAGEGEMTLSNGRRVRRARLSGRRDGERGAEEKEGDIYVHPNFRLVLLANRPGYPFLGNHFLQVLGENFSAHSVTNPDPISERRLLEQMMPGVDGDLIKRLVGAFQDLRRGYEVGELGYPYSLRELINLIRHMEAYPQDSLGDAFRNVFDFDVYRSETIASLAEILKRHGLVVQHLGLDAAREAAKKVQQIQFEPTNLNLDQPKEGEHDDKEHSGGNTYAGGTGGRDTAGMGGVGGYKRLFKGGDIKQVPDALKDNVPDYIKEKAREMARQELRRRLEELNMSMSEAKGYGGLLAATEVHMIMLHDLLEHLAAREEERVWVKRQTDGELDDSRLTEGLTGEATVYKKRGMEKPEIGRPQIKPKRIRFIFDLSASMYRFQYDGRLQRSLETAVMLMETFDRLSRKEKYVWDMYAHSGDGPDIVLVEAEKPPAELRDRWKVVEKMEMIPQYAFAGDFTVEAIEKAVTAVGQFDADDWFVIAITDANFERYQITPEHLTYAMKRNPKVRTALVCIGEGAEAAWITKSLPGSGFRVGNTADIPTVLRSILSLMVDR